VAGVPSEYDDIFDDDEPGRLLPQDDRIWRHPSEVSLETNSIAAEARAARDRWMSSTPTRAGAWSAGLVGAVLATGVVLVGMHLTAWLGENHAHPSYRMAAKIVTTTLALGSTEQVTSQTEGIAQTVATGLTVVTVTGSLGRSASGDGVVISTVGNPARTMILVPAPLVASASSIQVTTYDRQVFAGRLVGSDPGTGLAVVSVLDSDSVHQLAYASNPVLQPGGWLAAEWANPTDAVLSIGAVKSFGEASSKAGPNELLLSVDLAVPDLRSAPVGTVLVNAEGQLVGIVTDRKGNRVTEVPASLAELVGTDIARNGRFVHGWLGISAKSSYSHQTVKSGRPSGVPSPTPPGVEVVSVPRGSSAAVAGLKPGDVIEAVNGLTVRSMQDLGADLYVLPPNSAVRLTVDSDSTVHTVKTMLQPAA